LNTFQKYNEPLPVHPTRVTECFAAMPENGRFDFTRSRSGFGEGLAQNLPL
jgi:hypothetical protein